MYDTWARAARPLLQGGAEFMFSPRAQNTQATPLFVTSLLCIGSFVIEDIVQIV